MRELVDHLVQAAQGTFSMAGRYGQFCIVSPPREAVVTITAHVEAGSPRTSITTLVTGGRQCFATAASRNWPATATPKTTWSARTGTR